ncbi:MAG: L-aspartate oxidase [Thermodesulfobacteriota bacterium]
MEIDTDFLIIGSGVAGLMFALKVAHKGKVAIVTKKNIYDTNTSKAQGGVASVFDDKDSFDLHVKDTLEAGDGLCNLKVTENVVSEGPHMVQELIDMGVAFDTVSPEDKKLDLGKEGGHSAERIVHSVDMTGRAIQNIIVDKVNAHPNITVYENHIAIDLMTESTIVHRGLVVKTHENKCTGAYILDRKTNEVKSFSSRKTVLACGGSGKAYIYTSNPDVATGDGIAMAYRAGATVANLEFVQFHPTCLFHHKAKNFLISEAVRGEGAVLRDASGRKFMKKYSTLEDLACRDVVARAIDHEMKKSGEDSVFLDITHKDPEFIKTRFPNLYKKCLEFGIDMTTDYIPVVPAAHYMCGGVATDLNGHADVTNLYAIGETACTGLHGANRLASNSLLEALVYADKAAADAIETTDFDTPVKKVPKWDEVGTTDSDEAIMVSHNWDEIRLFMWNYVGIVRSDKRLERAKRRIDAIQAEINEYYWDFKVTSDLIELRNIALVAELIIKCALQRKESRGLHYSIDYPFKSDEEPKDSVLKRRI